MSHHVYLLSSNVSSRVPSDADMALAGPSAAAPSEKQSEGSPLHSQVLRHRAVVEQHPIPPLPTVEGLQTYWRYFSGHLPCPATDVDLVFTSTVICKTC